jgi:glutamyl-tRNA synthetase
MVQGILDGLTWLGLDWDEGPFFQSERRPLYDEVVARLLKAGVAYRDFGPPDGEPANQLQFRELSDRESASRAAAREAFAVRFRSPRERVVRFTDAVFGDIEVDSTNLDDFVIQRSDGTPTYHLCVVADDADMGISHVIRGADHLPNTPKHVLLFEGLGVPPPVFAHLPLILGPDRKRLSKRHGATSVTEFSRQGLLAEAVRNYIALLGWSPGDDTEAMPTEELVARFDLGRVNRANAVFDYSKLEYLNKRRLSGLDPAELAVLVRPELESAGFWSERWDAADRQEFLAILDLLKTRVQNLLDFPVYGLPFFTDSFEYDTEAVEKQFGSPERRELQRNALEVLHRRFSEAIGFTLESTEEEVRGLARELGLKAGELIGAVRVAMTGRSQAPGIFEVLVALGRDRVLARLDRMIQSLRHA